MRILSFSKTKSSKCLSKLIDFTIFGNEGESLTYFFVEKRRHQCAGDVIQNPTCAYHPYDPFQNSVSFYSSAYERISTLLTATTLHCSFLRISLYVSEYVSFHAFKPITSLSFFTFKKCTQILKKCQSKPTKDTDTLQYIPRRFIDGLCSSTISHL